jgi:hypothetical protein
MADNKEAIKLLSHLLEDAYVIIEERGLHEVLQKIPSSTEAGYVSEDDSFKHLIIQRAYPQDFSAWFDKVVSAFKKLGLSIKKLNRETSIVNTPSESNEPAILFLRRVKELEKIKGDKETLKSYADPYVKPPAIFNNGVLSQGTNSHKFVDKKYLDLMNLLWANRRITDSTGTIIKKEVPISRDRVYKVINSEHQRLTDIARGIKGEGTKNDIEISVHYPKDVYINVVQDSL